MDKIKIVIATHKKYWMPEDSIYFPLHVGREEKIDLGYCGDNTGDNISVKNGSFCELTGLYWAWKNLNCDYLGLVHYRRHFSKNNRVYQWTHKKTECVLKEHELNELVKKYRIIVPKKRNYYIETLYSHYEHTHYKEHLDLTKKIILEKYPEYGKVFEKIMKSTSGYMFNMYIMEKKLSDEYCEWLFDILFELEKRIFLPELSQFQGRFYGRVSEIIFNVWIEYQVQAQRVNKKDIRELSYVHMEKLHWGKKGSAFLKAKFMKQKYKGSF